MIAQVCSQMPPQTVVHIVSKNTSSAVHFVSNNTTCSSPPLPYVLTVYCERKRESPEHAQSVPTLVLVHIMQQTFRGERGATFPILQKLQKDPMIAKRIFYLKTLCHKMCPPPDLFTNQYRQFQTIIENIVFKSYRGQF